MGAPVTWVAPDPTTGVDKPIGTAANPLQTGTSSLQTTPDLTTVIVNTAAIGDTTVSTAVAAQRTRVYRMRVNVAGATTLTVKSGATVLETISFAGAGFLTYDFATRPWYTTAVNTALVLSNSAAVQVNAVFEFTKVA